MEKNVFNTCLQLAFDTPTWALMKTYVMMIGEFEFEGAFTENDDPGASETENAESARNIPFPDYSSLLFVVFVFVMSIIISNLLVGLAVDDIQEIQENAELEKLSMNVHLVLESERFLPHLRCCLSNNYLYKYAQPKEIFYNSQMSCLKVVKDIMSKEKIVDFLREKSNGNDGDEMNQIREKQFEIEKKLNTLTECIKDLAEDNKKIICYIKKSSLK